MTRNGRRLGVLGRFLARFRRDRRGSVAPMFAIFLVPLIGVMGVAGEVTGWYQIDRSMQNASDAAAVAAATNGVTNNDTGSPAMPAYKREAIAVASQYGYTSGANSVTVTPSTVTCPSGAGTCFQVKISRTVPFYLVRITKYTGNGSSAQVISTTSIANPYGGGTSFCLLALGGTITSGITANGGPKSDLSGCSMASNGDATCNGHNLNADSSYAYYGDSNCGLVQHPNSPKVSDPYSGLFTATEAAADLAKCGGTFAGSTWSSAPTLSSNTDNVFCGNVTLSKNITLTAGTIVIENGQLNLSGNTLTGANNTIVFSGTTGSAATHGPSTGKDDNLSITAPTTGQWSGIAVYQDPSLTTGVDITESGNGPTWDIVGLLYLPHSNVTISGAVNKNSSGACLGLVVNTITINGTGYILDHNGCSTAGLTLPGYSATPVALVQ